MDIRKVPTVPGVSFCEDDIDINRHQAFDLAADDCQLIATNTKAGKLSTKFCFIRAKPKQCPKGHIPRDSAETIQVNDPHFPSS
jgi:hypothetical protein